MFDPTLRRRATAGCRVSPALPSWRHSVCLLLLVAAPLVAQTPIRPGKIVVVDVPAEASKALDAQIGPRRAGIQGAQPFRVRAGASALAKSLQGSVTAQFSDAALDENRRFDQVTFVTAHNAFTSSQEGWLYAQQVLTIPEQLQLGVRGLMLDIYPSQDAAMGEICVSVEIPKFKIERSCTSKRVCKDIGKQKKVCRKVCGGWDIFGACAWFTDTVCEWVADGVETVCEDVVTDKCVDVPKADGTTTQSTCLPDPEKCVYSGATRARLCHEMDGTETCRLTPTKLAPGQRTRTLAAALGEVRTFLDANPLAIVTIFLESAVRDNALLWNEFRAGGVERYLFLKTSGKAWPTLKEMRASGRRLVVFANDGRGGVPNNWEHVVETQYDLGKYPGCEIRTETDQNVWNLAGVPLLTINHFFPIALDQPWVPERLQPFDAMLLKRRTSQCTKDVGRVANFIALDFVDRAAGVWPIVNALNGAAR